MFRRPAIVFLVLAATLLPARSGWGQISDFTPSLEASTRNDVNLTRTDENEAVTNSSFRRQSHRLSLDIPLTSTFLLSYNMIYTDLDTRSDLRTDAGLEEVTNTSNETFEPRVELLWDNMYYTWTNGFRFRKTDIESDVAGETRTQDNYFSRLRSDERQYLPLTDLRYEWFRRSDNLLEPEMDTNENRLSVELTKNVGPLRVRYDFDGRRRDDDINHIIQDRLGQEGIVTYNQSFFKNLLSVFGEYQIDADRTITRAPPTGGTIEEIRQPADGLYLDGKNDPDPTPADPLDDPLDSGFSDLIDNVTAVSADPPGSNSDVDLNDDLQNLAVRLQIAQDVNKIHLYVVDPSPPTSEVALDSVTWRVFVGTASDTWTEVGGVTSDFNSTENRFEITFPITSSRFFRVRNTNSAGEAILVTEMEVIGEETFVEKVRRVEESYDQNVTTRVELRPFRFLSFVYNFFYSELNTRPQADQRLQRFNSGTVTFTPHPLFNFTGRLQENFFGLTGEDQDPVTEDRYSAVITSTILPTLTQSVSFSRLETRERRQVGDVDTQRDDTFLYTLTGEIFRGFTMGLDVDWFRTWDFTVDEPADITSKATLRIDAQLRPDLRLTGDYAAGRRRGGDRTSPERISTGEFLVTFRPTPRINAEARLHFLTEEDTKGLDHEYRINWIVFTEGALELVADYRYERTEEGGEEQHFGGLTTHWKINKKTMLDVGWNVSSENDGDRLLRHSLTVSFVLRL